MRYTGDFACHMAPLRNPARVAPLGLLMQSECSQTYQQTVKIQSGHVYVMVYPSGPQSMAREREPNKERKQVKGVDYW